MTCKHEEFEAYTSVSRLTDEEGGPVTGYAFSVSVRCKHCKMPFQFRGSNIGISLTEPTVSFDQRELRCEIEPAKNVKIRDRDPSFN